ncbi:MAG: hypothetical protein HPY75_10145 [Actinobacteria bacterium]|nr:hypothetical protein [Actinomycetota bacterium]
MFGKVVNLEGLPGYDCEVRSIMQQPPIPPSTGSAGPPLPPPKRPLDVKKPVMLILLGIFIFVLIITIAIGTSNKGTKNDTKPTTSTEKTTTDTQTSKPPSTTVTPQTTQTTPEPAPQSFSGSGDSAIQAVNLNRGLAHFEMTHNGGANFAIQLYSSAGEYIDLLVNTIGSFNGTKVISLSNSGQYSMNVTASGKWTITVTQPKPISVGSPPISFSQGIRFATPYFTLNSGVATFKMTHNGSGNFAVILYGSDGSYIDLLANEIGSYSGSQVVPVRAGTYILDVEADGKWTIDITQ